MCEKAGVKAVALRMSGQYHTLYTNPEPKFGIISLGARPAVKMPAVGKVIGFHRNIAAPPKGEITAILHQPLFNRGGEKYLTVPKWLPLEDPYKGPNPITNVMQSKTGAERAVDLVLDKIAGRPWKPEVDVDGSHPAPYPASPGIKDITKAKIAFVTGGGLVRIGETPFAPAGATDGRFATYNLAGITALNPSEWEVHHGGYTMQWIKEDPHRLHPLPEIRQLEKEGKCGKCSDTLYSYSSLSSYWLGMRLVGEGILPLLKADKIDAVITDAT